MPNEVQPDHIIGLLDDRAWQASDLARWIRRWATRTGRLDPATVLDGLRPLEQEALRLVPRDEAGQIVPVEFLEYAVLTAEEEEAEARAFTLRHLSESVQGDEFRRQLKFACAQEPVGALLSRCDVPAREFRFGPLFALFRLRPVGNPLHVSRRSPAQSAGFCRALRSAIATWLSPLPRSPQGNATAQPRREQ